MSKLSLWRTISLLCAFCAAEAIGSLAQTFRTLHSFDGADGGDPSDGLVQATDGNLYGTTYYGGTSGYGAAFKITLRGKLRLLHSFDFTDGEYPLAGLVQATNGDFYGTTAFGGAYGDGTVFKMTPCGKVTTLYSFDGTDGAYPNRISLVQGSDGSFYGTTAVGGANNGGTIFRITPAGTLTTLYNFCAQTNCTDGAYPYAGLVQAIDGNFYGTTLGGGANSIGTVFEINVGGTLTTLHSFDGADGGNPSGGLVQATDGNLYGTALNYGANGSGGTVFKISPWGTLTTLYSFCAQSGCTDGELPFAGLVQGTDGNFYGTTYQGGTSKACLGARCGTIFRITAGGRLATLHSFDGTDGAFPYAPLVQATNGNFYGTTSYGGANDDGTVFSLSVYLGPFVETRPTSGGVGTAVAVLGNNLTSAAGVTFNGTPATFTVISCSEIRTIVPRGATTGKLQVTTPSRTLTSNVNFRVNDEGCHKGPP